MIIFLPFFLKSKHCAAVGSVDSSAKNMESAGDSEGLGLFGFEIWHYVTHANPTLDFGTSLKGFAVVVCVL